MSPTGRQWGEYDAKVRAIVAEHGWMAQGVFPTADDPPGTTPFTYTVGLSDRGHPELIVAGLDSRTAHGVLKGLVDKVLAGETLGVGLHDDDDVLVGLPVELADVDPEVAQHNLRTASVYAGRPVLAMQVLWPDPEGHLPSDPECAEAYVDVQRLERPVEADIAEVLAIAEAIKEEPS